MDIVKFPKGKEIDYPVQQELFERIIKLIHEYDDEIAIATVLGILDLTKDHIKTELSQ